MTAQLAALLGIGVIAAGLVAWSVYGLTKTVRQLRGDPDPPIKAGLQVTLAILSVRLVLGAIVAGLLVWTILQQ